MTEEVFESSGNVFADLGLDHPELRQEYMQKLVEAVRAEREACAVLAETWDRDGGQDGEPIAKAIRARGK